MAARLAQILLAIFSIVLLQINLCWGDALVDSGLDRTVNNTLQKYSELYPDVAFVVLSGGDNRAVSMRSLLVILGDNPSSLDYEHPVELRENLNDVNLGRIERMLARGLPSATLFGIGATAKTQRPNLCVITLDVEWIAGTRERASHFLLALPEQMDRKIPSEHWVDNVEFLKYVLDHEVYHCLDSRFNGPIPMSDKERWGEYRQYYNNLGACAYAAMMHLSRTEGATTFIDTIYSIRMLTALSGDVEHHVCPAIQTVKKMGIEHLQGKRPQEIFEMATVIRKDQDPGYHGYLELTAAVKKVLRRLGLEHSLDDNPGGSGDALANSLFDRIQAEYKKLFNTNMPKPDVDR